MIEKHGAGNRDGRVARRFSLQQAAGELRTATFDNREHLVVPVVALVEGVIHPVNASSPELVLAEELAAIPQGWNGRPVVWDHPAIAGQRVSANDPSVLEQYAIGQIFNCRMSGKKLMAEAWLDLARIETQGGAALELLERIQAGELVEVSVGAFVTAEQVDGIFEGKRYTAIWREILPDHLALLPEGAVGACSNEMGCGAPRAARQLHTLDASGSLRLPTITDEEAETMTNALRRQGKSLLERFRGLVSFRNSQGDEEMSDADLRAAIDRALFAAEPAYYGIEAVFPGDQSVVYVVGPDEETHWLRRTYAVGEAGEVTFGEAEEVRPVTKFEPVNAESSSSGEDEQGAESMEKAERVKALIDNEETPYRPCDQAGLEALTDETLVALEEAAEAPPAPVEDPPAEGEEELEAAPAEEEDEEPIGDPPAEGEPVELERSEEEVLESLPPELRKIVTDHRAAEAAKKTGLVATLVAAQDAYSEEELEAKDVDELEQLSTLAQAEPVTPPVDNSARPTPRVSDAEADSVPAPPSLATAIKERAH